MDARALDEGRSIAASATAPTCILVLGMHRSGTSALTRMLNLLGATLPKTLLSEARSNRKGYWEPGPLVQLHDELLAEGGSRWDDWRMFDGSTLPAGRLVHYQAEIARTLSEEYESAPCFVVKDPRLCRLMKVWHDVLDGIDVHTEFVLPLRNPLEVARSAADVYGLLPEHVYLLWLRHVLDAERETRGSPRLFLHYRDLLEDPLRVATHIAGQFGDGRLAVNEQNGSEIKAWIDPEQRHHAPERAQDDAVPDFPWLAETYAALVRLIRSPQDRTAQGRLDRIGTEFELASTAFLPALANVQKIATLGKRVLELTAVIRERNEVLASQKQTLSIRQAVITRQDKTLLRRDKRIAALGAEMTKLKDSIARKKAKLATSEAANKAIRESTSWRFTAPFRAASRLARRVFKPTSR
jgi:O-antigen biosynthesis protein